MEKLKIWNDNPSSQQAEKIADSLSRGNLAIIPTDSVYAIVCDALNSKAINQLCKLKGINPDKNHLSILCGDISMASEYAHIDNAGFNILNHNVPGPFTFLFRAARTLPKAFKGRKIVGIRIPDNNTAIEIIRKLGNPILSTSIEFDDDDEAREPDLIEEKYSNSGISIIVDGGDGDNRLTTIVDCLDASSPEVIREGKGILE